MNFDFFDLLNLCIELLNLDFGNSSHARKKRKYVTEKVSVFLYTLSAVLVFLMIKNPLSSEYSVQSVLLVSSSGLIISLIIFGILYFLNKYYFKNVFQWLFFSFSVLSFCITAFLWGYFSSGIF